MQLKFIKYSQGFDWLVYCNLLSVKKFLRCLVLSGKTKLYHNHVATFTKVYITTLEQSQNSRFNKPPCSSYLNTDSTIDTKPSVNYCLLAQNFNIQVGLSPLAGAVQCIEIFLLRAEIAWESQYLSSGQAQIRINACLLVVSHVVRMEDFHSRIIFYLKQISMIIITLASNEKMSPMIINVTKPKNFDFEN